LTPSPAHGNVILHTPLQGWCDIPVNNDATAQPLVKNLLRGLDVGSSVAEHDEQLERYFVETETFRALVEDRADVIAGDKGSGKSALYKILSERYTYIPELKNVEVISAFNPRGTPVFQRLNETELLEETEYVNIWKAYFLALAGNWILKLADGDYTERMEELHQTLVGAGLRSADDSPSSVFSKLINQVKRVLHIKSAEATAKVGPVEIAGKMELFDGVRGLDGSNASYDETLKLLESVLVEMDTTFWLAVDRLDEAFQGRPNIERSALRALLRTFLDMQGFSRIRLKLFVRRDLFRRIISGGFVNLTHVNARKIEIFWDEADLDNLLHKRIMQNDSFVKLLGADADSSKSFYTLFPNQVDSGSRKPDTWTWMMSRIGDGSGVKPPRNLIDLVSKARESQLRSEDRDPRSYRDSEALITSDAIKKGLEALSTERVEDTLLAEAGDYAESIDKFRGGKAEHDVNSLRELLGESSAEDAKYLVSIGFLEPVGSNFKVPMLYRGGLSVTQGKAF
jgi:hypothetical protein